MISYIIVEYTSKKCKSACNRDASTFIFVAAQFRIAKLLDQPRCPCINE
jgi:hypothetical protein